jgi:hypothetical protein
MLRVPYRSPDPYLTDPCPRLQNASIAPIRFCKRTTPNHDKKQKHHHTVIYPRRTTTLSSTFAGSNQFCVNAIASLSYNRVCPQKSCGNSAQDRSVFGSEYFLNDRRIDGPEIQKRTYFLNDVRCGATIGSSMMSAG